MKVSDKSPAPKKKPTKKAVTQKKGTRGRKPAIPPKEALISYELKFISLLLVTGFLLLSLHTQSAGAFGKGIKQVLTGLFSLNAFFLPYIFFASVFMAINKNLRQHRLRMELSFLALGLALIFVVGLSGVNFGEPDQFGFKNYADAYFKGQALTGGGAIGNVVFQLAYQTLGAWGTGLLIGALVLVFLTLALHITPSKILKWLGHSAVKTKDTLLQANANVSTAIKGGMDQLNEQFEATEDVRRKHKQHIIDLMNRDLFPEAKAATLSDEGEPEVETATEPVIEAEIAANNEAGSEVLEIVPNQVADDPVYTGDASEYVEDSIEEALSAIRILDFQDLSKKRPIKEDVVNTTPDIPIVTLTDEEVLLVETILEGDIEGIDGQGDRAEGLAEASDDQVVEEPLLDETVEEVFTYEHYQLPPIDLLKMGQPIDSERDRKDILMKARLLEETLANFKIEAKVVQVSKGPMITRFEIQPSPGVKVSRIVNLQDDIALNLAATTIRIVAPIPGKAAVGIEVPNKTTSVVTLRDVVESDTYEQLSSSLRFGLGKEISGQPIVADLAKMPHLLIAGSTGSGKSVCVNTIISSILCNAKPDEVRFLMIDPKVVELNVYNGIPHLILPVVTDPKKASIALNWAVQEMTDRYHKFAEAGVRDVSSYNKKYELTGEGQHMPRIVVIIDELADLMMVAPNAVEDAICRLAQMARAAGIHLIVATQRPSVDVITGVIKANIPSRIAFAVSSQIDSRTIIDMAGAEKLLGKGDMLYFPVGESKPKRVQGSFISEEEVEKVVTHVKDQVGGRTTYDHHVLEDVKYAQNGDAEDDLDDLLEEAIRFVIDTEKASTSLLQRRFRIGYNRAARLVDELEARGVVGPSRGSKPREVTMTMAEFESLEN